MKNQASYVSRPHPRRSSLRARRGLLLVQPILIAGLLGLLEALSGAVRPATASLALIRQGAESRGSRETGDFHGRSLAVGDFNGDGIDDLATGAPFEDVDGFSHAGAVFVNFGDEHGLTHVGARLLLQSDGDALETAATFGWALAAGDFDGDGYDDLAVGAPGADYDATRQNIGYVFVYAGGPSGLSYWHYLWQPSAGGSAEANDRFGASLCTGNFDETIARDDLAIGSPGEDGNAGAVFYYTGGTNGLLNGSAGWRKQSSFGGTNVAGDQFGYSLAAGQVWGNSIDELIVGTPFKEVDGVEDAGIVWVIAGNTGGPSTSSALLIRPDEGDLVNQPYPDGYFGWSVTCGRFYGGTFDGVAIGEPGRSYFGHVNSGRVVVGKGSVIGPRFIGSGTVALFQDDAGWALGSNDGFGRSLVAGYYDTVDGYQDLAIGSPTDNANGGPGGAGVVSILLGGPDGPGSHGWIGWAQDAWNDPIEANDQFATSLAFGRFERESRRALAIGSPGEDASTGMVCIAAPWRQATYPAFQNGIALDCSGNWAYALRPFDQVCIASTTKIMTVLIACERSQLPTNDPDYVDLDQSYIVPDWIRNNIGGSRFNFERWQQLTLEDLLYCCLFPSGNDAAFAIADLLTGGGNTWNGSYDNTVQTFVQEMNERAADLGMTRTTFTNPAGLDKGGPKSTAEDMIRLAQAAMANQEFRNVASRTAYTFSSTFWDDDLDRRVGLTQNLFYGFLQGLRSYNLDFDGLKGGWTPCANTTGVFSALEPQGRTYAATFGTNKDTHPDSYLQEADELVDIATAACGSGLAPSDGRPLAQNGSDDDGFVVMFGELPTGLGLHSGGAAELRAPNSRLDNLTEIEVRRPGGEGLTHCQLGVTRATEAQLGPLNSIDLGVAPFDAHGEIVLVNHGEIDITILVRTPQSGTPVPYGLAPGARAVIPPYSDPGESSWTYEIHNPSQTETVVLGVVENYSWSLTNLPGGDAPSFAALLYHDLGLYQQSVTVHVTGADPVPGRNVHIALRDPGVVVDVPAPDDTGLESPVVRILPALPNPFDRTTHLGFDLQQGGDVRLEIFDSAGRRLRVLERKNLAPGRNGFDWNGTSADGHALPPGVYFYRLDADGQTAGSGRVVRIR